MKRFSVNEWIIMGLLVVLKLTAHLLTYNMYEPHRDEFLYMAMKDHLAWGYLSVPPFIGFAGKTASILLGNTIFAYKLMPALAGVLTLMIVFLMVKELGGKTWAIFIGGASYLLSPTFLHINALFQPVSFDVLFWTLLIYLTMILARRSEPRYLIWLGVVSGIAILNKYSTGFLLVSLLVSLLLSPHRKILLHRNTWIAILAALLIVAPNLFWQIRHGLPVVHHLNELYETQLVNVSILNFSIDQLVMHIPALLVWVAGLLMLLFSSGLKQFRFIGAAYGILFILLACTHGKSYYMAGFYTVLFSAGGFVIGTQWKGRLRAVKYFIVLILFAMGLFGLPLGLPYLEQDKMEKYGQKIGPSVNFAPFRWEDGKVHKLPQDWADMTGWEELAGMVYRTYQELPPESRKKCFIWAENYGQAGAIRFYTLMKGLPEPVSFSDNFLLWAPDSLGELEYLIYVNDETEEISTHFRSVTSCGTITNPLAREYGLGVYLCAQPYRNFSEIYARKAAERKSQFR